MSKFLPADHYRDWFKGKELLVKPAMLDISKPAEINTKVGGKETRFVMSFQSMHHPMYVMDNRGHHWEVQGAVKTSFGLQVTLHGPILNKDPEKVMMSSNDGVSSTITDIDFVELKEDGSSVNDKGGLVKTDPALPLVINIMATVRANINTLLDPLAYEDRKVTLRDWPPGEIATLYQTD